jgi:hypothetical protein
VGEVPVIRSSKSAFSHITIYMWPHHAPLEGVGVGLGVGVGVELGIGVGVAFALAGTRPMSATAQSEPDDIVP